MLSKGLKILLIFLLLPLLALAAAYAARYPLLAMLAQSQGLQLHCQRWQLTGLPHNPALTVEKLCLQRDALRLEFNQVQYLFRSNHLAATLVNVENQAGANASTQPFAIPKWRLPELLPSGAIDTVSISAAGLSRPLRVGLNWRQPAKIMLHGDVSGTLEVYNSRANADLHWHSSLFEELTGVSLPLAGPLRTALIVTPEAPTLVQQLELTGELNIADCALPLSLDGTVNVQGWPEAQSLEFLPRLHVSVADTTSCQQLAFLDELALGALAFRRELLGDITLHSRKPLTLTPQALRAQHLTLQLADSALLHVELATLDFNTGGFRVESMLTAQDKQRMTLAFDGKLTGVQAAPGLADLQLELPELRIGATQFQNLAVSALPMALVGEKIPPLVLKADKTSVDDITLEKPALTLRPQLQQRNAIKAEFKIAAIKQQGLQLSAIEQQLDVQLSPSWAELDFSTLDMALSGTTQLGAIQSETLRLPPVTLRHTMQYGNGLLAGKHRITMEDGFTAAAAHRGRKGRVIIKRQAVATMNSVAQQLLPAISIAGGELNADIAFNVNKAGKLFARADTDVEALALRYQDYTVDGLDFSTALDWNSKRLRSSNGVLRINSVFAGIDITDIKGDLSADAPFRLHNIHGQLLGGKFELDSVLLSMADQQIMLQLKNIDAEQLIALEQQSGIALQARIDAQLPLRVTDGEVQIEAGRLTNNGTARLTIDNNAAFENLKQQQAELGEVLSLLEHLDISALDSSVTLSPDGWLDLAFKIKGNNPRQQQDVNFNYTHKENIFTLMKALRMGDVIKNKVQEELQ